MIMKKVTLIAVLNFGLLFAALNPIAWGQKLVVSPTVGIDNMIEAFKDDKPRISTRDLEDQEAIFREALKNGVIKLRREDWELDTEYCKGLDTITLAKKCFSDSSFSLEMMLFAGREEMAFMRLRVAHGGFAELFKRDDMWKGILAVYDMLDTKIDPNSEYRDLIRASTTHDALANMYFFPPFKKQLKGREQLFFDANLKTLKRYRYFSKNIDQYIDGYNDKVNLPFYREPFTVAYVALMLHESLNQKHYNEIMPKLSEVRFTREQKMADIEHYLDIVIPALETGVSGS